MRVLSGVVAFTCLLILIAFIFTARYISHFQKKYRYFDTALNHIDDLDLIYTHNPSFQLSKQANLAICIVGQTGRMELQSKITNLIEYNAKMSDRRIVVIGALDEGAAYSNGVVSRMPGNGSCYESSTNVSALFVDQMSSLNITLDLHVKNPSDFNLTNGTYEVLAKYRRSVTSGAARQLRIQNHLRQFAHDLKCYESLKMLEARLGVSFDALVRIRDNAIVAKPFDILASLHSVHFAKTLTKRCNSFKGHQDKVWVIPRFHIAPVMAYVVADVLGGMKYLKKALPKNSEALVAAVWRHRGVRVSKKSADQLPIVDGRCMRPQAGPNPPLFGMVRPEKDCRPYAMTVKYLKEHPDNHPPG
jgi:hypothetical protein